MMSDFSSSSDTSAGNTAQGVGRLMRSFGTLVDELRCVLDPQNAFPEQRPGSLRLCQIKVAETARSVDEQYRAEHIAASAATSPIFDSGCIADVTVGSAAARRRSPGSSAVGSAAADARDSEATVAGGGRLASGDGRLPVARNVTPQAAGAAPALSTAARPAGLTRLEDAGGEKPGPCSVPGSGGADLGRCDDVGSGERSYVSTSLPQATEGFAADGVTTSVSPPIDAVPGLPGIRFGPLPVPPALGLRNAISSSPVPQAGARPPRQHPPPA